MRSTAILALVALALPLALGPLGCAVEPSDALRGGAGGATAGGDEATAGGEAGDDAPMVAADDGVAPTDPSGAAFTDPAGAGVEGFAPGAGTTEVRSTANVNLRAGASTSNSILAVVPSGTVVKLLSTTLNNGFLRVEYRGTAGWSHSNYYAPMAPSAGAPSGGSGGTSGGSVTGGASPANAMARARASVGFSYWWGGGAWLGSGPTSSTRGSCSGSCPSCSHSGRYGADCSGMVAKAWQYGDPDLADNSHPYSTYDFVRGSSRWSSVSRGALRGGDAMAYNSNGAGHIVLYERGDGWGSPTVFECRGCAYGCVYNTRSFTSAYSGVRRAGF